MVTMIFPFIKYLKHDIANTLFFRGFSAFFSFLITIIIVRNYGVSLRGELVYILSVSALFAIGYLTLQHSIISLSKVHNKERLISTSLFLFFIFSFFNILFLYFMYVIELLKINSSQYIYIAFLIPLLYFQVLSSTYYQMVGKIIKYNFIQFLYKGLLLVCIMILSYMKFEYYYIYLSYIIIFILFFLHILIVKDIAFKIMIDFKLIKLILKSSLIIHISTISTLLLGEYNNFYIGHNFDLATLGYYDISSQISGIVVVVASSLVPIIYSRGINSDELEFKLFMKKLLTILSIILSLGIIVIFYSSELIINLVYGSEFYESSKILKYQILLVGIQVFSFFLSPLWILKNKLKIFSLVVFLLSISYILMLNILLPKTAIELIKILMYISIIQLIINLVFGYKYLKI